MTKNYMFKITVLVLIVFLINGCAGITEFGKTFWGSSTRVLQNARKDALSKTYERPYDVCFNAVKDILEENEARIFMEDQEKYTMLIMEIERCISTTEVGIFFVEETPDMTKVEISSISPKAKRISSEFIFSALDALYNIDSQQEPDLDKEQEYEE